MSKRNLDYVVQVLLLTSLILPVFTINRLDSFWLFLSFSIAFISYLLLWNQNRSSGQLLTFGILARLGLFLTMPILSDDIYRFLWDGFLMKSGIHPFAELPGYYLDKNISGLSQELFDLLNSQNHFTVYPPINQGIFWLAVTVSDNWLIATSVIRLFILGADFGSFYFLRKWLNANDKNEKIAFLFFLNPLVILEGVGNLHFEILVIFFLIFGLYQVDKKRKSLAGVGFGMAVGTKLLPAIFLPFIGLMDLKNRNLKLVLISIVVSVIALTPLYSPEFVSGMKDSLSLYFQNFTFNPSLFLIAKKISIALTGYNKIKIIGPAFSIASFLSIIGLSIWAMKKNWPYAKAFLFILTIYFLLATTIHPWYVLALIPLGLMSGYVFPIVWSFVIFITYMGYSDSGHSLDWWWIALEYLVVLLAFIYNHRIKSWVIIS